ncbi:uncharacterized protein LOC135681566 isoform X2 [Rhopilema esculentum]|uniref:uncharacterized protein LOC135681566 isoform X2 n=1 Tax=Rhopilema esculentum TaxID=499914 RepID=UPI0031D6C771
MRAHAFQTTFWREILARFWTSNSIMESAYAKVCCICSRSTKYRCISCQVFVCNRCSIAELDETNASWIPGQQVGYCTDCHAINDYEQQEESSTPSSRPAGDQKTARKMSLSSPCGSASARHSTPSPSSSAANFHKSESQHYDFEDDEDSEEDKYIDDLLNKFKHKNGKKNKSGRKAQWDDSLLSDMIDIVVSSEYYKKKLIFTNTKNQKNGAIYGNVLEELKTRASARNETVPFTAVQLRNKFKKAVAECKKAALTIKSATGIKRFQDEKNYGPWFNQLFGLVKTRDSCQPEQAIEPSAGTPSPQDDSPESSASVHSNENMYVPINRSGKKRKNDEVLHEILGVVKNMLEKDPMKDYVQFAREEAAAARQHEMRMMQMFMAMQQPQQLQQPQQQQQQLYNMHATNAARLNSSFFTDYFEREAQEDNHANY